ncbi:hypothetical protein DSECCO2_443070 [anaerobic digester metagenome]
MRGEDGRRPDLFKRLVEAHPPFDPLSDPFEQCKRRVPLVQVHRCILDAERMKHFSAADAEDDLLPEALLQISRVKPGRDPPVSGVIAGNIRIQEVERYSADIDLPDGDIEGRVDVRNLDDQVFAGRILYTGDGRHSVVEGFGDVLLPPVGIDLLVQVALRVHEPDGDHRETEVACLFQVIAGEESESARVDGERVVEPVLR